MIFFGIVASAALCGFLFGFDEGVVSGALPIMAKSFSFTPFSQGLMASAVPLGAIVGAIIAALLSDKYGRRWVIMASALMFIVGLLGSSFAPSVMVLTLARLIVGVAVGMAALVSPQYLAEVAPPEIRGRVVGMFQFMIVIGILISYVSDLELASGSAEVLERNGLRWRLMFAVGIVPSILLFVGMLRAPESPRWLAMKGRADEARTVLEQTQPSLPKPDLDRTISEMIEAEENEKRSISELFRPGLRHLTIFSMVVFFMQQLSGINALIYYAPEIFEKLNFSSVSAQLTATVGIGVVNTVATIFALFILDKIGRRVLLMIGFVGAGLCMLVIVYVFNTANTNDDMYALYAVFGFIVFFAISIGPLPWIYMSELFPTDLRSEGMMIAAIANWVATFLIVLLFPIVQAQLGMLATFAGFAGFCGVGFLFALFFAPETRGVPLEELTERLGAKRGASS